MKPTETGASNGMEKMRTATNSHLAFIFIMFPIRILEQELAKPKARFVLPTASPGSGKSSVADRLHAYGAPVIDVDQAGRWAVEHNPHVRQEIRRAFGDHYFHQDSLDREKMAGTIFSDEQQRTRFHHIVHPVMLERVRDLMQQALSSAIDFPYIVVDAALVFELSLHQRVDCVITVYAPIELCITRVQQRSQLTRSEIIARMQAQLPQEEKIRRADYTIDNSGPMADLAEQVHRCHQWLLHCKHSG